MEITEWFMVQLTYSAVDCTFLFIVPVFIREIDLNHSIQKEKRTVGKWRLLTNPAAYVHGKSGAHHHHDHNHHQDHHPQAATSTTSVLAESGTRQSATARPLTQRVLVDTPWMRMARSVISWGRIRWCSWPCDMKWIGKSVSILVWMLNTKKMIDIPSVMTLPLGQDKKKEK